MPSFVTVTSGATAQAQDVNQLINALNGSAGNAIPISLTALNDSVNFALAVKNADPTNSRSLQVLRSNNNVLIQADASGVIVSPDGGATTGQVLTVNATQTLTNKTLTSPHMTGPVVDSGGLTVTAGGLTVSAGGATLISSVTNGITLQNSAGGNNILVRIWDGASALYQITGGGDLLGTAGATGMTDGFVYIPSAAGAPTGAPTNQAPNRCALYYDITNKRLYVRDGTTGWKSVVVA